VGEVGGSLGLFLGISLLAAFDAVAILISHCVNGCASNKKDVQSDVENLN